MCRMECAGNRWFFMLLFFGVIHVSCFDGPAYIGSKRHLSSLAPILPSIHAHRGERMLYCSDTGTSVASRRNILKARSEDTGDEDDFIDKFEELNEENPILRQWNNLSQDNKDDIRTTTSSFIFALLIRCFVIEPRFIPSLSMFPTFDVGDQLLVDKVSRMKNYQRRDVVVFNPSQTYTELTGNTEALIKRIVGVEGDTIEVKNNKLYVNGVEQLEPYTNESPEYELAPLKVPPGMLLVLGDNRNHSFDSHIWGFLPSENVIGRAVLKYWPPWRVGIVEGST